MKLRLKQPPLRSVLQSAPPGYPSQQSEYGGAQQQQQQQQYGGQPQYGQYGNLSHQYQQNNGQPQQQYGTQQGAGSYANHPSHQQQYAQQQQPHGSTGMFVCHIAGLVQAICLLPDQKRPIWHRAVQWSFTSSLVHACTWVPNCMYPCRHAGGPDPGLDAMNQQFHG